MEELFGGLRSDVESVFMQAPTVQLEALATQVDTLQPRLEELVSHATLFCPLLTAMCF